MRKLLTISCLALMGLATSCVPAADATAALDAFVGEWRCSALKTNLFTIDMTLNIFNDGGSPRVLISSDNYGFYFLPAVGSNIKNGVLTVLMNDDDNRAAITLTPDGAKALTGTYNQYGETASIDMVQVSSVPAAGDFSQTTIQYSDTERLAQLKEYSNYADDGTVINFSYTLNQRENWVTYIDTYGLDALTEGKTDVELMKTLLYWVSDHFKHGNPKGAPSKKPDAVSVMEFCESSGGSTNCRGLSILLADLCRVYGLSAKHVTCLPKETEFNDCHVVVLAYSAELSQWVMLDPTYKLILTDENGVYINLQTLRERLISGETLVPNPEFSYNGGPTSIESYRQYMTKNTFRFTSATDFYFGAEETLSGNVRNMLVPVGYDEDQAKVTTTSDEAFWAAPKNVK